MLRRPNDGYDFGSWAVAMAAREELLAARTCSSSTTAWWARSRPSDAVVADFERTTADVWGMVESNQFAQHLQSFFRGFRYGVLAEPAMRRFWRDIRGSFRTRAR